MSNFYKTYTVFLKGEGIIKRGSRYYTITVRAINKEDAAEKAEKIIAKHNSKSKIDDVHFSY